MTEEDSQKHKPKDVSNEGIGVLMERGDVANILLSNKISNISIYSRELGEEFPKRHID